VKTFWKILAALLTIKAVVWLFVGNYERAFLSAAAGGVAWFLSYRVQLREKLEETDQTNEKDADDEESQL